MYFHIFMDGIWQNCPDWVRILQSVPILKNSPAVSRGIVMQNNLSTFRLPVQQQRLQQHQQQDRACRLPETR